jgi:hypothetical protein
VVVAGQDPQFGILDEVGQFPSQFDRGDAIALAMDHQRRCLDQRQRRPGVELDERRDQVTGPVR